MAAKRMPNLFVVGAMKAATTSLHNYLELHPDIFMTQKPWKEPCFFAEELNWNKGWDWYLGLFDAATGQKYLGESTTDYTKAPHFAGVPERIHAASPEAKIIYLVRDPIERAISHYWWEVEYSAESRNMTKGILENKWITDTSHYAMQIKPYLDLFGEDNVLILSTEELIENPRKILVSVFSWLGLATDIALPDEFGVYNRSKESVNRFMGAGLITCLKGTAVMAAAKKIIGPGLKKKLRKMLSREVIKDESGRDEVIRLLRPMMLPQAQAFEKLAGRPFSEWKTLYGKD